IAENTGSTYRTGTITIAGQVFRIEQAGAGGSCLPIPVAPDQVVSGIINGADCRSLVKVGQFTPYFSDRYSFEASAGQQIAIVASSPEMTPALTLFDPAGRPVTDGVTRLPAGGGFFSIPSSGVSTFDVR